MARKTVRRRLFEESSEDSDLELDDTSFLRMMREVKRIHKSNKSQNLERSRSPSFCNSSYGMRRLNYTPDRSLERFEGPELPPGKLPKHATPICPELVARTEHQSFGTPIPFPPGKFRPAPLDISYEPTWMFDPSDELPECFGNKQNIRNSASIRPESLLQWFDREATNELKKRRDFDKTAENIIDMGTSRRSARRRSVSPLLSKSSMAVDIEQHLRPEPPTELSEAVDKLAKAEALCAFAGAVRAAEAAAAEAEPELAEEAAVAGAKGYQTEITDLIDEEILGLKPIEVIGYVGVTRPKRAIRHRYINLNNSD